jgi:xanthine dehydrogenase accessory factor
VYAAGQEVLETGLPVLERYGVSDDDAFSVGLTCGGILHVYVEKIDRTTFPELGDVARSIRAREPVAVVTCIKGPADRLGRRLVVWEDRSEGSLGSLRLDDAATDDVRGLLAQGHTTVLHYGRDGERRGDELELFVAAYAPPPRLLVFGAIDFAAAVAKVGAFLGYQVTVCDARPVFATERRFPDAHEVVVEWPHRYLARTKVDERTVICVLTHDPKFDVPLLEVALRTPAAYIGAMGSRRTHADRLERLREIGLGADELARLHSPIGLDLGARTPEETAVSIAAEVIGARWGGSGRRLTETDGAIHAGTLASALAETGVSEL